MSVSAVSPFCAKRLLDWTLGGAKMRLQKITLSARGA
jgi:hypothetical protein